MKLERLTEILLKQKENLKAMLTAIKEKQTALVNRDNQALENSIKKEEKLLINIQSVEHERLLLMDDFNSDKYQLTDNKISTLLNVFKEKIKQETYIKLQNLDASIKNYITEIIRVNKQNMLLIQQRRQFISDTINAVLSSTNKSLIDRKG